MDSQTPPPDAPDPSIAMLHNATIDKASGNEFSNTARDMFKFVLNNYNFNTESEHLAHESSDPINHLLKVIPLLLAEVRKNDLSRSTGTETTGADGSDPVPQAVTTDHALPVEGDPVNIVDLVPSEPFSLPVSSVADRYTRSMLKCLAGYPLYEPHPLSELSTEYLRNGVNIGDVGFVRGNGTFDFLFNVCPSNNALINPPKLPDGFYLETPDHSATRTLLRTNCLFQSPITRAKSGEYICEGSEGAILELPEGAIEDEAMNIRPFANLAARHGVEWYEYTMTRGRDISNGSLYLITSSTKCVQWGIAVFDRPCPPGQGLKFDKKRSLPFGKSTSKYHWKGSPVFPTKVSNPNQGGAPNQCVFLRGYKIMIRQDIFENLCNDQPRGSDSPMPSSSSQAGSISMTRNRATRIRGGGGSDPMSKRLTGEGLLSPITMSTMTKSDKVALRSNFNSSLVHPSDLINSALLSQNPRAKVALTHDDVWCNLLQGNLPKLNYPRLMDIARSYMSTIDKYGCVSLEKISDPSNVLKESSRPLQGTETPALQGPRATLFDDCTIVPATISVTLPRELVERVLLLLETESMLTCRLVNKEFNEIIQSSILLQYFLACKAAGVTDNPRSPLSYAERLEALLKREDAWRKLKPVFETTIKVNHQPWSIYELTGGTFFLSDNNRKDLHYCHLPSSPQDNPRWIRIPAHGPDQNWSGLMGDISMALHEHDLMVNVVFSEVGNQADIQRHSLDLVLIKLSTGEYHPLARHPQIHLQRSSSARPIVVFTIAGDNIALVVYRHDGTFSDKLLIFDWKTGQKRLQHEASEDAYATPVFLSPELLLVPNLILSNFEVWHLPPSQLNPKPPVQILSLQLPTVSPSYSLSDIKCRGEPNPFLHSMPYFPSRPFFSSPENSAIMANLRLESGFKNAFYTLIVHRRALLDAINKWTSPSLLEQQDPPMWLTNEITVFKIVDPDDESVRLDAQSKLVSMMPHTRSDPQTRGPLTFATSQSSPTSHQSHISTDFGTSSIYSGSSTTSSTSRYDFLQVQWADWGPPISRWFQVNETHAWWMTECTGQRCAFSDRDPHDSRKLIVSVADFNPHNVKRNTEMMARLRGGEGEGNNGSGNKEEGKEEAEEEELEMLHHEGVFSGEVYMGLKCVVYHALDEYDFDVVLMDEERLLGLKLNHERRVENVKVLYFG